VGQRTSAQLDNPHVSTPHHTGTEEGMASRKAYMSRHIAVTVILAGLIALWGMLLPGVAGATSPTGITGTVRNFDSSTHEVIDNAQVCTTPTGGGTTTCTTTDAEGKYTIEELAAGEYEVRFTGDVCANGSCEAVYAEKTLTPISVTSGNLTQANVELVEIDGKISGRVTAGGVPVAGIQVCAFGSGFGCATTSPSGEYTIEHLAPGSYKVSFSPSEACKVICQPAANYTSQYWNGQSSAEAANIVTVNTGETTVGINAEMQAGGHVSGRVTNASIYAQPIANVVVCAIPTRTNKEGEREGEATCALTNSAGEYTISALASGGYEVEFKGEVCAEVKGLSRCTHPYIGQVYQSIVSVSAPGTTAQINGSILESAPVKPVNTAAPTVTVPETLIATASPVLSCLPGSWANNPTSLAYRWLRNGVAIAGQSANTYTVQRADAGYLIACEVTASNGAGASAAVSNAVQVPKPAVGVALFKHASVEGSTVSIKLLCTGASACSGVLKLLARVSTGHGKHKQARNVTAGLASFSMALGKSLTLRIHLTGQGRKLLAQAGKKGLEVRITGNGVRAHTVALRASSKRRG
jgi:Carboxypeptidase regulatory-like domain